MLDLAALGEMIRAARLRRGWRPIDFALEMSWSGTAPVYRLERPGADTPRPTPDTINLLAQVLELDYADRMTLLGFAGHLLDTEPLSEREEAQLINWTRPMLETSPAPMILYDFRERILAVNRAVLRSFEFDSGSLEAWRAAGLTAFDLLWDARHGFRAHFVDIDAVARSQMLRFKLDNRLRRHEAWYRAYPACAAHLPGFKECWDETERILDQPVTEWDLSGVMPRSNDVIGPGGQILRFDASRREVPAGYGLVALGVYLPRDDHTKQWMMELSQSMSGPSGNAREG
jgi:transcriptional regulator with XRE-family HTH domain